MKTVLTHFVQKDKYEVPDDIAEKDYDEIEQYIVDNELEPVSGDTRDWEIVDVS